MIPPPSELVYSSEPMSAIYMLPFIWLCCWPLQTVDHDGGVEILSGTILVFSVDPNKLIVAADSRIASYSPRAAPNDRYCKIIALSKDTVFFYSGGLAEARQIGSNALLLSANKLARTAFK